MPIFIPRLRRLLAEGHTLATAGQAVGLSKSSAHRWIERYGMEAGARRRTKPRLLPEQRARIQALQARGTSKRQTAATVGVARSTVRLIADAPPAAHRCRTCGGKNYSLPCQVCAVRGCA